MKTAPGVFNKNSSAISAKYGTCSIFGNPAPLLILEINVSVTILHPVALEIFAAKIRQFSSRNFPPINSIEPSCLRVFKD